ncbi:HslU--HslV peptidase ATPase subunit [Campylobacter sp.]|uniref:HslU--HslV peptidase ATPase subunit n=1 Tax=Campylobacter sp. TaxID=205 RepID=UPI002A586E1B|nr:HslU--HslV peptidase ATPase subunit [Campylobacter sp.]MDD7090190.1 HslU--HslV peptidase ATPase subunit [Campylobacteraceae bacterium]MDY5284917.1 HslU--HslV peptidase ATPase subunit [Campylobacter sp.]
MNAKDMKPKEIVEFLNDYVIGQKEAKKVIAIALRNRWRRMQLSPEMQDDIIPKNILMIGSTGVGKTEIARRLAKMFGMPFIKVEASKYTEVGFVGRDVESMVRDLAAASLNLLKEEERKNKESEINEYIEKRILERLLPPLPKLASEEKLRDYEASYAKMRERLKAGELDNLSISIEIDQSAIEANPTLPPEMSQMQDSLIKVIGIGSKKVKKELKVKDAKNVLKNEACEKILDIDNLKSKALERAENEGIIFIDEIDKVAVPTGASSRTDPSKEGVQRDLLPIVEGSSVNTNIGALKTDHILFIAAGAFHLAKPSDLIPELQGRFPLRVNLDSLDEDALFEILTKPKNALPAQYKALLGADGIELEFEEESLRKIAALTHNANEKVEDIGARRLHTVIERVLEDISFECSSGKAIITAALVEEKLADVAQNQDLAKYIL